LVIRQLLPSTSGQLPLHTEVIALVWCDRQRARQRVQTSAGTEVLLMLPRGTVLQDGDLLYCSEEKQIRVQALPEAVVLIPTASAVQLCRVAHQLGNWHRPAQVLANGTLMAQLDQPLIDWLEHVGIPFETGEQPFQPNLTGHAH
jgi:urease accessory protein